MNLDNETHCHEHFDSPHISNNSNVLIVTAVLTGTLAGLITITNLGFIVIVGRYMRKCSSLHQNKSQVIMMSLATSDAMIGAVVMPQVVHVVLQNGKWTIKSHSCLLFLSMNKILAAVSIYHVTLMAIDRYLATCKPHLYRNLNTKTMFCFISCAWVVPILTYSAACVIGFKFHNHSHILACMSQAQACEPYLSGIILQLVLLVDFFLPISTMYTLYILIAREIHSLNRRFSSQIGVLHDQKKDRTNNALGGTDQVSDVAEGIKEAECKEAQTCDNPVKIYEIDVHDEEIVSVERTQKEKNRYFGDPGIDSIEENSKLPLQKRNSLKAYSTIGCIVMAFSLCWLPFNVYLFITNTFEFKLLPSVYFWLSFLSYANSLMNPIWFFFTSSVRDAVWDALCCGKKT